MKRKITFLTMLLALLFAVNTSLTAQVSYCEDLGISTASGDRSWSSTTFTIMEIPTVVKVAIPLGSAAGEIYRGIKNTTPIDVVLGEEMTIRSDGGFNWMYNLVWIDWNGDGVFDETTEKIGMNPETQNFGPFNSTFRTFTFNVPTDAKIGETRARVMFCWLSNEEPDVTACSIQSLTNNAMVCDFILNVKKSTLDAARTVTVQSANTEQGTAVITGTEDTSITTDALTVSVTANPVKGFFFDKWTSEGVEVSQDNPFIYRGTTDITLVANFVPAFYRPMSRFYTGANPGSQQADRYFTDAIAKVGSAEQTLVSGVTENPNPIDPGVGSMEITDGGLVDYTGTHIVLPKGTTAFDFTAKGKQSGDGLQWTQQNVFIDWNQDFDFVDEGEAGVKSSNLSKDDTLIGEPGYTRTITVPNGTAPGLYRMRVIYHEPSNAASDWSKSIFNDFVLRNGVAYDFVIELLSSTTGLENTESTKLNIRINNGVISVDNVDSFEIYSICGQKLNTADTLQSGIYIVKTKNAVEKVLVK